MKNNVTPTLGVLGAARVCPRCSHKLSIFYVLNEDPLDCPNCKLALEENALFRRRRNYALIFIFITCCITGLICDWLGRRDVYEDIAIAAMGLAVMVMVVEAAISPLVQNQKVRSPRWMQNGASPERKD
jgi:hypothetical protein